MMTDKWCRPMMMNKKMVTLFSRLSPLLNRIFVCVCVSIFIMYTDTFFVRVCRVLIGTTSTHFQLLWFDSCLLGIFLVLYNFRCVFCVALRRYLCTYIYSFRESIFVVWLLSHQFFYVVDVVVWWREHTNRMCHNCIYLFLRWIFLASYTHKHPFDMACGRGVVDALEGFSFAFVCCDLREQMHASTLGFSVW